MNKSYTFKISLLHLFVYISIFASLMFTGFIVIEEGASVNWYAYMSAIVGILVISIVFSFFIVLYYKTTLQSEGVKGYNFWGKSQYIEWENISKVKPIKFLGLKYLRVFSGDSRLALWVPLFLKDTKSFVQYAITLPPEGNVFREYYK